MPDYQQKATIQKDYYDATADKYDDWQVLQPSAAIVDDWNFANLQRELGGCVARILDLGCGTGRLTAKLLELGDDVVGLDVSEAMLKIARAKYPGVKFLAGEVIRQPFENNSFDLVVINGALHHFFALETTLQEAARVLKSGGLLAVLGEPNAAYGNWKNPFTYYWAADRTITKLFNFVLHPLRSAEVIEPDAETFTAEQIRAAVAAAELTMKDFYSYDYLPRHDSRWFVGRYRRWLEIENKTLAKWFSFKGSALQFFAWKG